MDTSTWIVIAIATAVVLLAIVATAIVMRRRFRAQLRDRFGPEYDRTVDAVGRRRAAERDLQHRAERRDALDLHPLTEQDRQRLRGEWIGVQASFVDDPMRATIDAERLIDETMRARDGEASTDESRQAVLHYRLVFDRLLDAGARQPV